MLHKLKYNLNKLLNFDHFLCGLFYFVLCECLHVCLFATHVFQDHRDQRRHWTSWSWSCTRLQTTMWVLETKLGPLQEQQVPEPQRLLNSF